MRCYVFPWPCHNKGQLTPFDPSTTPVEVASCYASLTDSIILWVVGDLVTRLASQNLSLNLVLARC